VISAVDHLEAVAGQDEDVGLAAAGDASGPSCARPIRARAGWSCRRRSRGRRRRGWRRWHRRWPAGSRSARCASVFGEVVDAHRLEGAGADVQGQPRRTSRRARQRASRARRSAGRRWARRPSPVRGHRPSGSATSSAPSPAARDVGRQRQLAVALEQREQVLAGRKVRRWKNSPARPSTSTSKASASAAGCRSSATCWRAPGRGLRAHRRCVRSAPRPGRRCP
jgi:hypothetical protein